MWLLAVVIGSFFPDKAPDRRRIAHWLGFASPEMRPHWIRLRESPSLHAFSNIWTEWVRLDPQRGWKTAAAVIDLLVLVIILVWVF